MSNLLVDAYNQLVDFRDGVRQYIPGATASIELNYGTNDDGLQRCEGTITMSHNQRTVIIEITKMGQRYPSYSVSLAPTINVAIGEDMGPRIFSDPDNSHHRAVNCARLLLSKRDNEVVLSSGF